MSTNTTNTNNGNGRPQPGAPESARAPGKTGQENRFPFASFPMPAPETLERLANEFFLVMPQDLANGNGAPAAESSPEMEMESEEIPITTFPPGVELLPLQNVPRGETPASAPASFSSTPPGPLTENDLRAIAASLAGATALVPGMPGTVPTPPVAGAPPDFLVGGKVSPLAAAPLLPPGNEMFSMPGIPRIPAASTSMPTGAPGGADLMAVPFTPGTAPPVPGSTPYFIEGDKGRSPGAAPVLPPVNDLFSFPRVPAMPNASGIQTVPNPPAPLSSPSAPPSVTADASVLPAPVPSAASAPMSSASHAPAHDQKGIAPQVSTAPAEEPMLPATDRFGSSTSLSQAENLAYQGLATNLPSLSELFSFPGVPGVQSFPGAPILPSSVPTSFPPQEDAQKVNEAAPPSAVPGFRPIDSMAPVPGKEPATGSRLFEFQPDVVPELGVAKRPLDARLIRRDFPILEERVHGRPLIWLDNAATTQKPNAVIDRISYFYRHENSNIHRAAHTLAARATDAYESAREKARHFLNASSTREIIFVRGTTEGINLIAQSWGRRNVHKDDEIVITWLEHHANIVPWQQLCSEKGARLRVAPVNDRGEVILEEYEKLLNPRTRIVSFSQVSNALGTITPAREMVEMAHRQGACVLVDGAQAVSHLRADVQSLDCDFYVFSGHKVFGPTGIGVAFGKLDVLENMPPWQGGGNMIADVTFEKTTYQSAPARFEAGTGNIADAVGLGAALDYVEQIGMESIAAYEHELLEYGTAKLLTVPGLRLIGTAREKAGVMSFVLDDVRTEDVGVALNQEGIAVRSGHHCAQPILRRMGVESSVRPSLAFYNTCEDLDHLVAALLRIQAGRRHRGAGR
jgi:cysteine desulfurase / selenocysteine lyase